jgi:hypothetical protein
MSGISAFHTNTRQSMISNRFSGFDLVHLLRHGGQGVQDGQETTWLGFLRKPDLESHVRSRSGVLAFIDQAGVYATPSPLLTLFKPLLSKWDHITTQSRTDIASLLKSVTSLQDESLHVITHKYFKEYLTVGFDLGLLPELPHSWDEFVSSMCFPPVQWPFCLQLGLFFIREDLSDLLADCRGCDWMCIVLDID